MPKHELDHIMKELSMFDSSKEKFEDQAEEKPISLSDFLRFIEKK